MTGGKKRGFTVIEMMIVVAVLTTLIALLLPPLLNSLRIVNQEGSMLAMDQSANRALNAVTAELRQAVLPIILKDAAGNDVDVPDKVIIGDIKWFMDEEKTKPLFFARFMNNETVGFGKNGQAWLDVLERGTDFLPFTVPVPLAYGDGTTSVTTLDSAMLPQLGIYMADESPQIAATYTVTKETLNSGATTRSRLLWQTKDDAEAAASISITDVSSIHPTLAAVHPDAFNLQTGNPAPIINLATGSRYQPNPFAGGSGKQEAYGVIRFAPLIDETGTPFTLAENGNAAFDLNEDGVYTDSYGLGRIEILYIPADGPHGGMQTVAVSTNTVLLHLNTDSKNWQPIFKLRRGAGGGYAVDITLLLCDRLAQESHVLAFNQATPFLVRRYNSSVELRNMAFR